MQGYATNVVAQCASPKLLDAIPPDGARDVPFDWSTSNMAGLAPLTARYDIGAVHNGEPIVFQPAGEPARDCGLEQGPWCLPGTWNSQTLTLSAFPPGGLQPGVQYEIVWPALGSINDTGRRGEATTVRFSVGYQVDEEPPRFEGLTSVDWDFERKFDSCSNTDAERYVFQVGLAEPSDDGGADLLTLHVFQTKGPGIGSVPSEVHVERYRGAPTVRVTRPISAGVGHVCFSALVGDPGGRFSATSASREVCTKTVRPPFFDGCALERVGQGSALGGVSLLGLLVLGVRRRTTRTVRRRG